MGGNEVDCACALVVNNTPKSMNKQSVRNRTALQIGALEEGKRRKIASLPILSIGRTSKDNGFIINLLEWGFLQLARTSL
jgi:hypothetical protein